MAPVGDAGSVGHSGREKRASATVFCTSALMPTARRHASAIAKRASAITPQGITDRKACISGCKVASTIAKGSTSLIVDANHASTKMTGSEFRASPIAAQHSICISALMPNQLSSDR
jgi:hypothetical protein